VAKEDVDRILLVGELEVDGILLGAIVLVGLLPLAQVG